MNHTATNPWKRPRKRVDQNAIDTLYGTPEKQGLISQLTRLTFDQDATTAEVEEALALVPALQRYLRDWVTSRHLCESANRRRPDVNTPAEDAAMDELERLAKTNPSLNPIFNHLLSCVRPA